MDEIDWEQLDMIADGFSAEFLEIFQEFAAELPVSLAALQASYFAGEMAQVARVAHQIKGSAGNFGFAGVSAAAAEIERSAKEGSIAGFPESFARAHAALSASLEVLRTQRGVSLS